MNKLRSLRAAIVAAFPDLETSPDRLIAMIEQGAAAARYGDTPSCEDRYTATIIITDFTGDFDALKIAVLEWLKRNQPETLLAMDKAASAIAYEVDILAGDAVDLMLKIPLTERMIAIRGEDGRWVASHPEEPDYLAGDEIGEPLSVRLGGEEVAVIGTGASG